MGRFKGARRRGLEQRRREAEERAGTRTNRTAAEQLASLDHRLGAGIGAQRERERLGKELTA